MSKKPPAICKNCKNKDQCTELCEKARKYIPPVIRNRLGIDKINSINPVRVEGVITPPHSFLIFRMFFFEKKSQRQIAEILGVSQAHVSKTLKRIKEEVIKKYAKTGYIAP
jgi:predicted DNA-binding protein (UPF0251 family)